MAADQTELVSKSYWYLETKTLRFRPAPTRTAVSSGIKRSVATGNGDGAAVVARSVVAASGCKRTVVEAFRI